jgi:uncharacterized membrane protein
MPEISEQIAQLQERLENLVKSQISFQNEISHIRREINELRVAAIPKDFPRLSEEKTKAPVKDYVPPFEAETNSAHKENKENKSARNLNFGSSSKKDSTYKANSVEPKAKSDLEKFIGENLISKIGIVILIIGVGIGAKYAIDNDLISPLGRIIIGYAFGFGLLGFAVKLKAKYLNFSSVLLSGAMAIMYFITFSPTAFTNFSAKQPLSF